MALQYERIANDVRAQIRDGALAPGQRLPTEDAMATKYGVSKNTIRQAMNVLQAEGLVLKRHGRGTFVSPNHERFEYPITPTMEGEPSPEADVRTTVHVRHLQAGEGSASVMETPEGTWLIEYTYLNRRTDQPPHALVRAYVPRDLVTNAPPADEDHRSPWGYDLHQRLTTAGVTLTETTQRLTARHATAEEAAVLTIPVGAPVLAIQRQTRNTQGHVVEAATCVLTGSRTEAIHTATLTSGLQRAGVPPVQLAGTTA